MNPETYPHRKDTAYGMSPDCRCGADDAGAVGIGATWGTDCPAALREALETERGRLAALGVDINRIIDMQLVRDDAPEIIHTMERHYRMVCETAGKNGDMVEDLCRAAGIDWDCDDPVLELRRRRSSGPHITPALMRRIEALGFTPGSGEPVGWLVAQVEELAATLANERGEGEPPCAGYMAICEPERPDEDDPNEDIVVRWHGAWDGECDTHVGTSAEDHLWWWSVMGRTTDDRLVMLAHGRASTARAAMQAADAARGTK